MRVILCTNEIWYCLNIFKSDMWRDEIWLEGEEYCSYVIESIYYNVRGWSARPQDSMLPNFEGMSSGPEMHLKITLKLKKYLLAEKDADEAL